jgi:hypothetical protein
MREESAEHHRGESGERRRHVTEFVQAHVNPRNAGEEQPEAEPEAEPEATSRPWRAPRVYQPTERDQRERIPAERREGSNGRGAEDKCAEVNRDCPYLSPFGLSTRTV